MTATDMRPIASYCFVAVFLAALLCMPLLSAFAEDSAEESAGEPSPEVFVLSVSGPIGPVVFEYLQKGIKDAGEAGALLLVIELDTPGGLMDSTRDIIKVMVGSPVPVAVYVSPGGARAASAGTFITMAAHIAAMAPRTNIGAAHPVIAGGEKMDETMSAKVTNDAAAFIRSLAEMRGRNVKWAEAAVRESVSATAEEALKLGVIDFVSPDLASLIKSLDGRKVKTVMGDSVLDTSGAKVKRKEPTLRHRILKVVANPNVAYVLMILGIYGLFFEMTNPGAIFPGVVGGICIILAFYSFQVLPVNYAGLLLILLAVALFILESQVASYGALAMGGVVAMFFGSLMLFDKSIGGPFVQLSISLVIATTLTSAAFFIIAVRYVVKAHRKKPITGVEGLMGQKGTVTSEITADSGQVFVRGEYWNAVSDAPIAKDSKVIVESVDGLSIKVKET